MHWNTDIAGINRILWPVAFSAAELLTRRSSPVCENAKTTMAAAIYSSTAPRTIPDAGVQWNLVGIVPRPGGIILAYRQIEP